MLIRPAQAGDFDAIAALTNHYITTTTVHFGYDPMTAEELRQSWLGSRDAYPFLVAEGERVPGSTQPRFLGFAKTYRWRERQAYARTAESGIYIALDAQGQGIGKCLYGALIGASRDAGFHTLIGGIAMPNAPSVRLHESCGFVHVGTFREVGWKLDAWRDVAFYQLML